MIANYHLGVSYAALGKHEEAIANFKRVLEVCPDDQAAAYHLGMAYYNAHHVGEATGVFRNAIQRDPEDRRALNMFEMLTEVPSI